MNNIGAYVVSFPGLGIDNLRINPIAIPIGDSGIYWYGIIIAAAVLLSMMLILRQCERFNLRQDDMLDIFLVTIPAALIGARIYYVIFAWDQFKNNLRSIFDTRQGGLAFYGGVILGVLAVLVMSRIKKIPFHRLADFMIVYVPLGQGIGRWGNFFNQEAFGSNTSLPWGMFSDGTRNYLAAHPEFGQNPNLPVHPTFLYEFLGNMVIFLILYRVRKQSKVPYETFSWYLLLYGLLRFFVESIRTDPLMIGDSNIRVSWLLSGIMVLLALIYLSYVYIRSGKRRRNEEMAVMLGETADGEGLDVAVPELNEEEAARFAAEVAEAQGSDERETREMPSSAEIADALADQDDIPDEEADQDE